MDAGNAGAVGNESAESARIKARLGYLHMTPRDRTLSQGRMPLMNELANSGVLNIDQKPGSYYMPGGTDYTLSTTRAYTVAEGVQNYQLGTVAFAQRVSYNA